MEEKCASHGAKSNETDLNILKARGVVNLIVLLGKEKLPWDVERTKPFLSLLKSDAKTWIEPLVLEYRNSSEFKIIFEQVLHKLLSATHISEFGEREYYKYDQSDFECASEKGTHSMELLATLFKLFIEVHAEDIICNVMRQIGKDVFVLIISNIEEHPWTSKESIKVADELLNCLKEVYGCTCLGQLLVTDPERTADSDHVTSSNTFLASTLQLLQPRLIKGSWKRNPSFMASAVRCLFLLQFPHMGEYLDHILPISLSLVDDYVLENKILGVRCLHHIISNTTKTQLQWQGRSEVIYEAVKHQLYTHEVALVEVSHPCILAILKVVEISPNAIGNDNITIANKYDEVLTMILHDAEMETRLVLRRAYTQHLRDFVQVLGLRVVKHSKRLLRVITSYLEMYDGPLEIARLNTLAVLKSYILQAWPRIRNQCGTILKSLLRLLYELSVDNTLTSMSVKQTLVDKITEILFLLKCVCRVEVEECMSKMLNVETSPLCGEVLQKVLDHSEVMCPCESIN